MRVSVFQLPLGPNGRACLPADIVEMSFSTDDEDEVASTAAAEAGEDDDDRDSDEDATSETLVKDEDSYVDGYE